MKKKKRRHIRILWWSLGEAILFGVLTITTIIGIILRFYPIALIAFFCLIYGNITMLLGRSLGSTQDFVEKNESGTTKFGDYDSKPDTYLERDYK